MKKKLLITIIMSVLLSLLIPSLALAANISFGSYDLSSLVWGETLYINTYGIVNLFGSTQQIQIVCDTYSDITFNGYIIIDNKFDVDRTIVLKGSNIINLHCLMEIIGANNISCIYDESGGLQITGDGSLVVNGGQGASCIYSIGSIDITGGTLYVSGDVANGFKDIECDALTISGQSAVFLEHGRDGSTIPTTNHKYHEFASKDDVPAGYNVPDEWEYPIGAYLNRPPNFTSDATNSLQTINPGDPLTPLKAEDPDGEGDISEFIVMGGSLPPGISLNNDGSFSGSTNIAAGTYTATIFVKDICGYVDPTTLTIEITNAAPYFTGDAQNTVQSFKVGGSLSPVIAHDANGDSEIAGYSIVGGNLPPTVTINNSGEFTGDLPVGSYKAVVEVRDTAGLTSTTEIDITVAEATVDIVEDTVVLGFSEVTTLTANTDPPAIPINWYSSEPSVATVDVATGEVTAGTTQGMTVVGAYTSGGSFDRCIVHVVDDTTPEPAPDDPVKKVTVQITDGISPMAGYYVSLFSDPQTVVTDSNGIARFDNVPYNTNAPHMLLIQSDTGTNLGKFYLYFSKGSKPSTTVNGNNINTTFDNDISGLNITLLHSETVTIQSTNLEKKQIEIERVVNPQTGDETKPSRWWLFICLVPILLYMKKDKLENK